MHEKRFFILAFATSAVVLVPLVAMLLSDDAQWGVFDFVIAAGLVIGAGLAYELFSRSNGDQAYRVASALTVLGVLALIWINLAVGIIGSEDEAANLMYAGVIAVIAVGALIVRADATGMFRVMLAAAGAQVLIGVIALASGMDATLPLDLAFGALWGGAALLFRRAASPPRRAAPAA